MKHRDWVFALLVVLLAGCSEARPQREAVYPVYRGEKQLSNDRPNIPEVKPPEAPLAPVASPNIESLATVARASNDSPIFQPSLIPDHSAEARGQMVDSDTRTPPKLKEYIDEKGTKPSEDSPIIKTDVVVDRIEANGRFELGTDEVGASEGKASHGSSLVMEGGMKGVAVPVIMDEDLDKVLSKKDTIKPKEDKKKGAKPNQIIGTTTPSSGLSTWILLSDNRDATTPSIKKSSKKDPSPDDRKPNTTTTTKKPQKQSTSTVKPQKDQKVRNSSEPFKPAASLTGKKTVTQKLAVTTKTPTKATETTTVGAPMSVLETMVKNQKKPLSTSTTTTTIKPKVTTKKTQIAIKTDKVQTKNKPEVVYTEIKKVVTIPPALPITTEAPSALVTMKSEVNTTDTTNKTEDITKKKKKSSNKKRKKNKNKKRKPSSNGTELESKIKTSKQPVGTQFYNYLSREIMPTVGLGLVGVLVTAGLAGLLGYNPFLAGGVPVRRTYESKHGYSPNYYNYATEYADEGGQSEESLFSEVLSGMPAESRYNLPHANSGYPESQLYNSQEQAYSSVTEKTAAAGPVYQSPEQQPDASYGDPYDKYEYSVYGSPYSQHDDTELSLKAPGTSYVYPEKTIPEKGSRISEQYPYNGAGGEDKYKNHNTYAVGEVEPVPTDRGSYQEQNKQKLKKTDTIERQPEALYRVSSDTGAQSGGKTSESSHWHRIGTPVEEKYKKQLPNVEPGPRSIKFDEVKARKKRSVIQRIARKGLEEEGTKEAEENEIDSEELFQSTDTQPAQQEAEVVEMTGSTVVADVEVVDPTTDSPKVPTEDTTPTQTDVSDAPDSESLLDILKRLTQLKVRLGLSFLKSTTDAFSKYLEGIQQRVDDSIASNTKDYNNYFYNYRRKNWTRNVRTRTKRSDKNEKEDKVNQKKLSKLRLQQKTDKISRPK